MYAEKNLLKEKLNNGNIVIGMESWFRDPRAVEILGKAGFDYFFLEYEHVSHNWEGVENLIRTAQSVGMTPLFRCEQTINGEPPLNQIIKALKCGAQIILVPHLDTPEVARKVVQAVKYPPLGKRGIATCDRSAKQIVPNESITLDMQDYITEANEETMIWAIIESPEAVKNIDAILEVEGIDAVGFGHQDYSVAAGLTDEAADEVLDAMDKVRDAAIRHGKFVYWNADTIDVVYEQVEKGVRIFNLGVDIIHFNRIVRKFSNEVKAIKL